VIRRGYILQFLEHPKLTSSPPFSRIPVRPGSTDVLVREVETLLEKQAIVELFPPFNPGFYSHIFTVTKKDSDKLRLVINLSPLNKLLVKNRFKMETPSTITYALQQGDWTISVDLTDAYLHVPMHPSAWKFIRFVVGKRVYEFTALPFGLSPAPYVFLRVMSTISRAAHKRLLHLCLYLDDSLLKNAMRERLCQQIPVLLGLFDSLGFLRNDKKSLLIPSQTFIFLGVFYNLLLAIARIPEDRWNKIATLIPALLAKSQAPAREWCVIIGLLTSAQNYVQLGRLHMRRLQLNLNRQWKNRINLIGLSHLHVRRLSYPAKLVVGQRSCDEIGDDHPFRFYSPAFHGCIHEGLGGSRRRDPVVGPVVCGRGRIAHKLIGDEGRLIGGQTLSPATI
jgi:hypothetical protein